MFEGILSPCQAFLRNNTCLHNDLVLLTIVCPNYEGLYWIVGSQLNYVWGLYDTTCAIMERVSHHFSALQNA